MFLFCLVFAMSLCISVYMCFVVTCWERADLLQVFFWPALTTDIRSCSQCQIVCFFPNLNKKIPNSRNKKKREKK